MPKFLNRDEIYRLYQRELPEDVYPDGPPSGFYSTADVGATSVVLESAYSNLARIYDNYWIESADERILDWETTVYGRNLAASLTLQQRRDLVGQRYRARKGLTVQDMIDIVKSVIGINALVDIGVWGSLASGTAGSWVIGVSQLGINTILGPGTPGNGLIAGIDLCSKGAADFGLTNTQWAQIQQQAYGYTVNIYDRTLTAQELVDVDRDLTTFEPARSGHTIASGLDPHNMIAGPVYFSLVLEDGTSQLVTESGDTFTTE